MIVALSVSSPCLISSTREHVIIVSFSHVHSKLRLQPAATPLLGSSERR